MSTSAHRTDRRRRTNHRRHSGKAEAPVQRPVVPTTTDQRPLIGRILDSPHLATVVPQLSAEVLQRLIQICGLEDCGEMVALATPAQLERIFDLDLWRPRRPGSDDELDPERFGKWLEVLVEAGPEIAAEKLAAMDAEIIIAALAQHIRVFDHAAVAGSAIDDGDPQEPGRTNTAMSCEIGSHVIEARRFDAWDAIVSVLASLAAEHAESFRQVMSGCRHLSNSGWELDGLNDLLGDNEQDMFDLSVDRERRREEQGYVSPPQARAFLQSARQLRVADAAPPSSVVARAYFRGMDRTSSADRKAEGKSQSVAGESDRDPALSPSSDTFNAIVELLAAETRVAQPPRALLGDGGSTVTPAARFEAHMQFAYERDPLAYATRSEELAYLANVILAGCSTQGRSFTPREASDAAAAVCNLGLENFPAHWLPEPHDLSARTSVLPQEFLITHGLIDVFQVGWTVLYDVAMRTTERLIGVLNAVGSDDVETQTGFDDLCAELRRQWRAGTPWGAREALDVLLVVDQPAWATLVGLISEYPVIHAGLAAARGGTRAVNASAFEFISENRQIRSIYEFLESLPEIFAG